MIKGIMSESLHIKGIMSKEFSAIRCLDFNGETDYVDCGNHNSLNPGNEDFTWEAWANTSADTKDVRYLINKGEHGVTPRIAIYTFDGNLFFRTWNAAGLEESYVSKTDFVDANWYQIIALRNSNKVYLYIDNILIGSDNLTLDLTNTKKLLIGVYNNITTMFWSGKIGISRIYKSKALNATERQNNFNGKITRDGLVAEWLFREQKGNILHDSVGSNDGTIYGADWYEKKFNIPLKGIMSNSSEITGIMTAEYI